MLRPFAVPMLGLSLLLAVLVVPPALAGTQADPDVTDPSGDRAVLTVTQVPSPVADAADLKAGWVSENATHLFFNIESYHDIAAGLVATVGATASYEFAFHFTLAGTDTHAEATVASTGTTATAPATAAAVTGAVLNITVPKSALSSSAAGTLLTGLEITVAANAGPQALVSDEAPGTTGTTRNYTITGGAAPVSNPNDTDGDGLNNTFEQANFGSPTSPQNGTGDPDGDGCNNLCEQKAGTDPNKADTDGDGATDAAEIAAGTDPKDPKSKPAPATTSTTTTPSTTSTTTSTTSSSTTTASTSSSSASVGDKLLKVDPQYTYVAAGGAAVVILLAIIGRFGRWGL